MALTWKEFFLGLVEVWSQKSKCKHYHVGAIFVREKQVLQGGYNGPTAGDLHCDKVGCAKEVNGKILPPGSKLCRGGHAEMNSIVNAAKNGTSLSGCDLWCKYSPCWDCAKHLNNLKVKRVFYLIRYEPEFKRVKELFDRVGIKLIQIRVKNNKKGEKHG